MNYLQSIFVCFSASRQLAARIVPLLTWPFSSASYGQMNLKRISNHSTTPMLSTTLKIQFISLPYPRKSNTNFHHHQPFLQHTLFQPTSFLLFLGHSTPVPASGIRCSLSRSSYHEFLLKWCALKELFLISSHPHHSLTPYNISCGALVMNSSLLPILEL